MYGCSVKKDTPSAQTGSHDSAFQKSLRILRKYVRELKAILVEACKILNDLVLNPMAEIVRHLCSRFYILQEYFAMRYQEAQAYAIAALGRAEAILFFP